MIPILLQPEPADFNDSVRVVGNNFLKTTPKPTVKEWEKHPYWRSVLPEMRRLYGHFCAYCATRIPASTGEPTVDHFIPRKVDPKLAYEWDNFRLAAKRFNTRKGVKQIVDPFKVGQAWFTINFVTFLIEPNSDTTVLPKANYDLVIYTIKELKLNLDPELVEERIEFIEQYKRGETDMKFLHKYVPFIAFELERQQLQDEIKISKVGGK